MFPSTERDEVRDVSILVLPYRDPRPLYPRPLRISSAPDSRSQRKYYYFLNSSVDL